MNVNALSSIIRLLVAAASLGACAQSDQVQLKLLTGLESNPVQQFFNHQKTRAFATLASIPGGQTCAQRNIYAGFQIGEDDSTLQTFPMNVRTPSNAGTLDATWVKNNAIIEPITLRVPKGLNITVGIIGNLIRTTEYDTDGISCAPYTLGGGGVWQVQDSASLIGYTKLVASSNQVVPLQTWILDAAPNSIPTVPSNADCQSNVTTDCPGKDFQKIFPATSSSVPFIAELEYFKGSNQPQGIKQLISYTAIGDYKYAPDFKDMLVRFRSPTGALLGDSIFSQNFPQSASVTNGATYKLNQKHPVNSGAQSGFFIFSNQQSGSNIVLFWSSLSSITNYNVQSSISINGPFTTIQATGTNSYLASPTLGATTYFRIQADADGLFVESSPLAVLPLSAPGAPSFSPITNGASFTLPTVTGATQAEYQYQIAPAGAWSAWQSCASTSACTVVTGSSGSYNAKFAFKNNQYGYVESAPIGFTAL